MSPAAERRLPSDGMRLAGEPAAIAELRTLLGAG
jgi:hypothetical protein